MKQLFKKVAATAALATMVGMAPAQAQKEPIKFGLLQDFTAVYTFVTSGYNQGQRDYLTLINEQGGIDGHRVEAIVVDTGNQPQRGIEAYNRVRRDGAILVDFLSTPVANAMVNRVLEDEIVMLTVMHGRGDTSDGETFPFVFPLMTHYWSQAALLVEYIDLYEGGLKGKKIAHVHIDSPFGREPIPILQKLAEKEGFTLRTFPYASPGNEQTATWSEVRRFRPDHVFIWGAGGGQAVSVRQAIRNGISADKIHSVVWLAESDMHNVGADIAKGVKRFEATATGTDTPILKEIMAKVVDAGKSAGEKKEVGNTYYNIGVASMAITVEGARLALKEFGAPLTGDKLRKGIEMIKDFDAQGLIPPVTYSSKDHQGGGFGRVSQWNGKAWEPVSDWHSAYQDLVWNKIRQEAAEYKKGR